MSLYGDAFVDVSTEGWMEQRSARVVRQRVAASSLGAQVGVHLVEVGALKRRTPLSARR